MTTNNSAIVSLTNDEVEAVNGGVMFTAALVGIAAGLVYRGGELHDAICDDHK